MEKGGKIGSFEDDFLSIGIVSLGEEFFVKIEFDIGSFQYLQFISELIDDILNTFLAWVSNPDMNEFPVGRIGKSFAFRERMDEEISIIPLGDVFHEIGFWSKGLDEDVGPFSGVVGDVGVDFFFYVVLGNSYLGFEEKESDKFYSFNRQCISHLGREEDLGLRNFLELQPF